MRRMMPAKGRRQVSSGLRKEIERLVRHTANEFECSKSFVVHVALEQFFGVKPYDDYRKVKK